MNVTLRTLKIRFFISLALVSMSLQASAKPPPNFKPTILAACSSLLSGNKDEAQAALAQAEVQRYLDGQYEMLTPEALTKGNRELKNTRKNQLAEIEAAEKLVSDLKSKSESGGPAVSATVIQGNEKISDFISQQLLDEEEVQFIIDAKNPPLSLRNYLSNLATFKGSSKLFFPALFFATSYPIAHSMWNAIFQPDISYETDSVLLAGVTFFALSHRLFIKMGKAIGALGVPSLRADMESVSATRTNDVQNYLAEISSALRDGPNSYAGRTFTISQPISQSLSENCEEFMAGDLGNDAVMKGVSESLRLNNSILPKKHSFSVDLIFQYQGNEPSLTIVGRCR